MMPRARLLVADDKPNFLTLFEKIIDGRMDLRVAGTAEKALGLLAIESFDVVVTDVRMPGMDGVTLLREIKARTPAVEVILVTGYGTIAQAVQAMKLGAFTYLTKPFDPDDAWSAIGAALDRRRGAERQGQLQAARVGVLGPTAIDEPSPALEAEGPAQEDRARLVGLTYKEVVDLARDRVTREYLVELLRAARGNVTRAAQRAGVERESFHRLMRRFQLRAEDYRAKT